MEKLTEHQKLAEVLESFRLTLRERLCAHCSIAPLYRKQTWRAVWISQVYYREGASCSQWRLVTVECSCCHREEQCSIDSRSWSHFGDLLLMAEEAE